MAGLKTMYSRFVIGDIKDTDTEPDVSEWDSFLASLPAPADCVDAAYNKYLCRMRYFSAPKGFLVNCASGLALLPALLRSMRGRGALASAQDGKLVVERIEQIGLDDILPGALREDYGDVIVVAGVREMPGRMCDEAAALFWRAWRRHPFSPYFLLYVLKELSRHSSLLLDYNPQAVAVYVNERNLATPILRELYEQGGRKIVSFMHGHYLLDLIQAYSWFSEFYVWDERYTSMFADRLKFNVGRYVVYTPEKLSKKWRLEDVEPAYDFTYYFCAEKESSIPLIESVLSELVRRGARVKVRPHPRYSHNDVIRQVFAAYDYEEPASVSMEESLGGTRYAIGLQTTVLYEAQVEGRGVVVDDVGNPQKFANLANRMSLILDSEHLLLSQVVECWPNL